MSYPLAHDGAMTPQHPWSRYVAIGDSFTEGIGDPEPRSPGGHRGWADRVAEVLSDQTEDFAYANLAVRGRLLQQILDEQVEPALELHPDLITVSMGGNDVIRPGTDPDDIAARFDVGIERLSSQGATVVMFNGPDIGMTPGARPRPRQGRDLQREPAHGRAEARRDRRRHVVAARADRPADVGARPPALLARRAPDDRPHGAARAQRRERSRAVRRPNRCREQTWRAARRDDIGWAREYFAPWILRRLRHQSSGDGVEPKRPTY